MNVRAGLGRAWAAIRGITFAFSLDLGVIWIYTALWRECFERDSHDYVRLFVVVLGHELVSLNLYETGLSRASRA